MRIAYFTESLPPQTDGVATTCAHLLSYLEQAGIDFHFFAPFVPPGQPWRECVTKIKAVPLAVYPDQSVAAAIRLDVYRRLDQFRPHLLHLTNPSLVSLLGLNYALERKLPVVASYHDRYLSLSPAAAFENGESITWHYLHWLHRCCDALLMTSAQEAAELRLQGFDKVQTWPCGVDTQHPARHASTSFLPAARGTAATPVVFYAGRLDSDQNLDLLLTACRLLRVRGVALQLVLAGNGPLRAELESHGSWIRCLGSLKDGELAHWYGTATVVAFPSTRERSAQALLQAAAAGAAIVGAWQGWPAEIIQHGVTGLLADHENPHDLSGKIELLLREPELRLVLGVRARQAVRAHDWKKVAAQVVACYRSLNSRPVLPRARGFMRARRLGRQLVARLAAA